MEKMMSLLTMCLLLAIVGNAQTAKVVVLNERFNSTGKCLKCRL